MFVFFNDTATTEIYTLSLHDALPISPAPCTLKCGKSARGIARYAAWGLSHCCRERVRMTRKSAVYGGGFGDRKSTRLNSSHLVISYAVFCLKKKISIAAIIYIHTATS